MRLNSLLTLAELQQSVTETENACFVAMTIDEHYSTIRRQRATDDVRVAPLCCAIIQVN